jgi:ankyrin repeat protein
MLSIPANDPRATAVVSAIKNGEVERLQNVLAEDPELASARIVDARGTARTLLHVVADWPGHFPNGAKTVALLASAGTDVNAAVINRNPAPSQEAPLHWAASSDDVSVLDALLDAGANIEVPGAVFTGGTPMSDAVIFGQWKAARRLLERGAQTTIWQAAALGLLDRVKEHCLSDPPQPPDQITNSFWHACHGGQLQTAAYLLDRGANLNWVGYDKKTPLQVAEESGAEDLIQWLRGIGSR